LERIAVISDVHGNLEALAAVLEEVEGVELYCLGDFVDYGAQPNEVIEAIRARGARCVLGNHDAAAITGDTSLFNARAAMSSVWTRRTLTRSSSDFLKGLPLDLRTRIDGLPAYFAHGSPDDRLWEYVDPRTHADLFGHYLDRVGAKLMGLGHTHIPFVWKEGSGVVFNPGSVGQPRDGDWRASYASVTFGEGACAVEIRRVGYDVEGAAEKILDAGLPGFFAERLHTGT
jgi:diadenosine tetraphosphatase ApaH/serine/threonine PP2A family protein phosphatase